MTEASLSCGAQWSLDGTFPAFQVQSLQRLTPKVHCMNLSLLFHSKTAHTEHRGEVKRAGPRLCDLAPAASHSQEAGSPNLRSAFFTIPVVTFSYVNVTC